jgi:hypothetical protein
MPASYANTSYTNILCQLMPTMPLTKGKKMTRRKQMKSSAHGEDYYERQHIKEDDGDQDVEQPNIKFTSLKEQSLFCGDIPDDDPVAYHGVEVGHGSAEELAEGIEGLVTRAEQADMSRDSVRSLRLLVTEYEGIFRLKIDAGAPVNVKFFLIKLCDGAEPVRIPARKYAPPQLKFMRDNIRELKELKLVY